MKKVILGTLSVAACSVAMAQTNPAITEWLRNTTGVTGSHYNSGSSTPITDPDLANVESVKYSATNVYVTTDGVPTYITGPFLDGNPYLTTAQNAIYKFPLNPVQNTGTPTSTTMGNIGNFINGVSLFDYRDGVSWKNSTSAEAGGPLGGSGDGVWNRDAVLAEMSGFDCSKGHPAMGNYHHHQNPSAYNLDLVVLSNICDLYTSDGLYVIDNTQHSPLIGFAYDGFPIYGAYGYKNADGTGGIVRIKSSYQLRSISVRTHYADGTDVTDGPPVSTTYPLGRYKEDYEYIAPTADDYLDEHNGRFCVTPEYPAGIYCYFATVDADHNSAYPYVVGPTFYGVKSGGKVTSISESTTTYTAIAEELTDLSLVKINVYPNPASSLVAVQLVGLAQENYTILVLNMEGKTIMTSAINQGSTMAHLNVQNLEAGEYMIQMIGSESFTTRKLTVTH